MSDPWKLPNTTDAQISYLLSYGYKVVSRADFESATDRPAGLLERAAQYAGGFVLYDPDDDGEGFLLVGERAEISLEGAKHLLGDMECPVLGEWSGSPDPADPDNFWIDDNTGERINAATGERCAR